MMALKFNFRSLWSLSFSLIFSLPAHASLGEAGKMSAVKIPAQLRGVVVVDSATNRPICRISDLSRFNKNSGPDMVKTSVPVCDDRHAALALRHVPDGPKDVKTAAVPLIIGGVLCFAAGAVVFPNVGTDAAGMTGLVGLILSGVEAGVAAFPICGALAAGGLAVYSLWASGNSADREYEYSDRILRERWEGGIR